MFLVLLLARPQYSANLQIDVLVYESVDHILGVLLLSVAIERHGDLGRRSLEFGSEVALRN